MQTDVKDELGKRMLGIWDEVFKMPTIGPLFPYLGNMKEETAQLSNLADTIIKSQITFGNYCKQISEAYLGAVQRIGEKTSSSLLDIKTKKDLEEYRKIVIDCFEEEFTKLFNSKEFAVTYRDLLDKQMDLLRQMQRTTEKVLEMLNLPTRKELDVISKDLHELRRSIMELQDKLDLTQ